MAVVVRVVDTGSTAMVHEDFVATVTIFAADFVVRVAVVASVAIVDVVVAVVAGVVGVAVGISVAAWVLNNK